MLTKIYYPGVWDLLHVGHVLALEYAKRQGNCLLVGVPSDEIVKQDKGEFPTIPLDQRIKMLESLKCVTGAIPYYHLEFITALEGLKPHILVVGPQWGSEKRHKDAEEWVKINNARIHVAPYWPKQSTTQIKEKVIQQHESSLSKR